MTTEARGFYVVAGAIVTSALFSACAPDLKTSDGEGGAGGWGESASVNSSSAENSSSAGPSSSSSGGFVSSSSNSSSGTPNPTCSDNTKNGTETDVDCGGATCMQCEVGQGCFSDLDCSSSFCSGMGVCAPAANCMDGIKNGTESDVDCGGGTCSACALGFACNADTDCQPNVCMAGTCQKPPVFIAATTKDVTLSFNMPLPNGVQTNDLLFMFVAHGGGSASVAPPSGWTTIEDGSNPGSDPKTDIYYTIYDMTTSLNFTMFNSDGSAILAAFRGVTYGGKGTLNNSASDTISTIQTSTLVFVSLKNGGNEVPAIPPGFTSAAIGNGNSRSIRVGYASNQAAGMYTLSPVVMMGEILPSASLGIALY